MGKKRLGSWALCFLGFGVEFFFFFLRGLGGVYRVALRVKGVG